MQAEETKNLPVAWEEELANEARDVAVLERPKFANFSIRSGILAYQGVAIPGNNMDCVVVASGFEQRLYEGAFDPDNPSSPVCFALSLSGEDMAPHEKSKDPKADSCAECPNNKWGSAMRDGRPSRGKACKSVRRLILIPKTAIEQAKGVDKAEMGMLSVPVTSVSNWANYVNLCSAQYKRPPYAMLTNVGVKPHMKNQIEVTFNPAGLIMDQETVLAVRNKQEMARQVIMAPYDSAESAERAPEEAAAPKKGRKY
jgi:hypothetical protein